MTYLERAIELAKRGRGTTRQSRRRVHELRAGSDAVAVGTGTVRADHPRLDARDVTVERSAPRPGRAPRLRAERVGDDVLLDAYVHEP